MVYAQHVALMGQLQERTISCFETGEGTQYQDYPCFHQIMAEDSGQTVADALFSHILPLAEGIETRLENGIDVPDAGCGRGQTWTTAARSRDEAANRTGAASVGP